MAVLKCKMCGGDLTVHGDSPVVECEYCGSTQTIPTADDDKKVALFDRAERLRRKCEFNKAEAIYEKIVTEFPTEPEGYWGLCLCRYGIEYVDDPATLKKIPTCHRTSYNSIFKDESFEIALEYADSSAVSVYRQEAKEIDRLQKAILEIANNEDPYDIFICYKETDEAGNRTKDSVRAQEIYQELTKQGYKVFFSRITLEDKLGTDYEPYIFAALNSAKIMLAIGTSYDNYNAVWVKNEWGRFLELMEQDPEKKLIPCYEDVDAYDIPDEFSLFQGQDMSKLGFLQDLVRGIDKIMGHAETKQPVGAPTVSSAGPTVDALLMRGFMFCDDKDWKSADEYFEHALDQDPMNAQAYLGKLMVNCQASRKEELGKRSELFEDNRYYRKIKQFGSDELQRELQEYLQEIVDRNEYDRQETIYNDAVKKMQSKTLAGYDAALGLFRSISGHRDAQMKAEQCEEAGSKIREEQERVRKEKEKKIEETKKAILAFRKKNRMTRSMQGVIAGGSASTVGVAPNGTICYAGWNQYGQGKEELNWAEVISVSAGAYHTVGVLPDRTVVAAGQKLFTQCNVDKWDNIIAVAVDECHTIGLRADGTVVATGSNEQGQCNTQDWWGIKAIATGWGHTVGLRNDGSVVAVGFNKYLQCNVSNWEGVVDIAAGHAHTVGLRYDGSVVATGLSGHGQCNVSEWSDIVSIAANHTHTVGLRSDGTVVSVGENKHGECNVSGWKDIVAIAAGGYHTIGLKKDGTVVTVGVKSKWGQCDVTGWKLLVNDSRCKDELEEERDALKNELDNLHGLFTGTRKKEITQRLIEIEYLISRELFFEQVEKDQFHGSESEFLEIENESETMNHHSSDADIFGERRTPIEIIKEKCNGCGLCFKSCPKEALYFEAYDGNKLGRTVAINDEICDYCGQCVTGCTFGAINER